MQRSIETKCKICGKLVIAKFPHDKDCCAETLQEAVDKFLPMVVCNRCYDIRDTRNKAMKLIEFACRSLMFAADDKRASVRENTRRTLEKAVPLFIKAICAERNIKPIPVGTVIEDLLTTPEGYEATLTGLFVAARVVSRQPALPQLDAQPA